MSYDMCTLFARFLYDVYCNHFSDDNCTTREEDLVINEMSFIFFGIEFSPNVFGGVDLDSLLSSLVFLGVDVSPD